jgi:hypothetical protein
MRKTKRFTPKILDRFKKAGRGLGVFEDYKPWHQVSRSDPSSNGRSYLNYWKSRQREFLSDGENATFLFATMLPNVIDIREQFPISLEDSEHEINDYLIFPEKIFPGTLSLSNRLSISHPKTSGEDTWASWIMTTDLLLTLIDRELTPYFLAISVKPEIPIVNTRIYDLLLLEKIYWQARNVDWLLITPELYKKMVAKTIIRNGVWGISNPVDEIHLNHIRKKIPSFTDVSYSKAIKELALQLPSMEIAQRTLWQSVWKGELLIDLDRSWHPSEPIKILDADSFWDQNPIYARRSSWI